MPKLLPCIWLLAFPLAAVGQPLTTAERAFKFLRDDFQDPPVDEVRLYKSPDKLPPAPPSIQFERSWQNGRNCGPISLYLFLRLNRVSVSLDEVLAAIPTSDKGCSLADLQVAAARFGVGAEAVKVAPEDLVRLPKPAILHYALPGKGGGAADHFDLIVRHVEDGNGTSLDLIDTTNCLSYRKPAAAIGPQMSGLALVPTSVSRDGRYVPALWAAFTLVAIANTAALAVLVSRRARANRAAKAGPVVSPTGKGDQ